MVRAATETAVNASISTPVWLVTLTVAVISIHFLIGCGSKDMSTEVIFKGWHNGITSPAFFAAMMPATLATPSTSPFLISLVSTACNVACFIKMLPFATASLVVISLAVTSTILALPYLSMCVSFGIYKFQVVSFIFYLRLTTYLIHLHYPSTIYRQYKHILYSFSIFIKCDTACRSRKTF